MVNVSGVIGFGNKMRVLAGRKPEYDEKTLATIGSGATSGTGRTPFFSWNSVRDAYVRAGFSLKEADALLKDRYSAYLD